MIHSFQISLISGANYFLYVERQSHSIKTLHPPTLIVKNFLRHNKMSYLHMYKYATDCSENKRYEDF